jgi:peptidoglycan hydrolase-like protein with peptidoglycan-binding domain
MTEPASIRYNNPGAMWGGNAISRRWGEQSNVVLNDGKHQNNHIAGFPTKVHGAAAQIDLWRVARYRNKPFAEAIKVWSGGNSVDQYIHFVTSRVPGMTAETRITDEFLDSPSGIAFLKAQAWHEAGKPYPMSDAEWKHAQDMVFAGAAVPKAAKPVAAAPPVVAVDPNVEGDPDLYSAQKRLKGRNYSPGIIDGTWGSGTAGAISAFRNDAGMTFAMPASLDEFHGIKDELAAELQHWEDGNRFRPVTEARAKADAATVAAVAPEVVPAKQNRLLAIWGAISTFFAALYKTFSDAISNAFDWMLGFFTDHKDDIPTDPSYLQTAWGFVTAIPTQFWIFAAAIGLGILALKAHGAVKKITESVQTGARQ